MRLRNLAILVLMVVALVLAVSSGAWAQVNTVNLFGTVLDPQNLAVKDARITVKNVATGAERTATADASGRYDIVGLPPGRYSMTVEAGAFAPFTNSSLTLTLGAAAEYNPKLRLKSSAQTVSVEASPDVVDTSKTDTSSTITSLQIDNLPINGRNYINFTLLNSQAARDDTPSIGAAPTSGLNFGGQRGRSNEVSVDGADAVDNSVNGVRATVSQEAVQEFQVITSNYMPEYGRAMGGVVNIVTKSGSNQVHGDLFGYLRDSAIQARNPFSVDAVFDPTTESFSTIPVKQSYTRVQSGATIGGPIQKDKTFYFFSYEITRRQETGFTNIGANNFGFVFTPTPADLASSFPGVPGGFLTPGQSAFVTNSSNPFISRASYFGAGIDSSAVALFGNTPGFGFSAFPDEAPLPASYVGLVSTIGNYPISEGTSLWSLKLDHIWNSSNTSFIRANVSPSSVNGIQVNAQNQNFGQNAGSRTSSQQTRDLAIVGQHTTAISNNLFNEFRFQYARRGLHYGYSDLPGGSDPAVNIAGAAFIGREPFSTEDRTEKRYEFTDDLTWTKGVHTFKFGVDSNLIQLQSSKSQIFTLNYGGVYDFGSLGPSDIPGVCPDPTCEIGGVPIPSLSPVQAYGLGIPTIFYQGVGSSDRPFDNKTIGVFAQDSWKVSRKLTLNYGLRYDIEFLPTFKPGTALNAAAEQAFGVIEGIPESKKNFAPRIGLAWDPVGDGKTVIRAGYGIFYDHPALALAFLSTAEDGATSALLEAAGGAPDGSLNATSIFQGILNVPDMGCDTSTPMMCYEPNQQRFNALQPNSLFINQNFMSVPNPYVSGATGYPLAIIPYTIPVTKNFKYGYAQQGNFSLEREITKDWKVSMGYNFTHGLHLDRTININVADPGLLISNDNNAVLSGVVTPGTNPLTVEAPSGSGCVSTSTGSVEVIAPTILGLGFATPGCNPATAVGYIGTAAAFNNFRPSGPNPTFGGLVGGYPTLVGLAQLAGFPQGFAGVQVPWSDVNPQTSTGNSIYNAFTLTVTKRFSNNLELLSSWTYSHTIDDSTDLSTLLNPQDNSNPNAERGNSDFDQRHRWITSAVYLSPYHNSDGTFWKKLLADFTVAPVLEVASGRPFNVLIGSDTNLDFGSSTGRPSVQASVSDVPAGFPPATVSPFISGVQFILPTNCLNNALVAFGGYPYVPSPPYGCTGNLGRNAFTRPGYFDIDLRIARKIPINEHMNLQVIADGFNMLNRFNVSDVNPVCDPTAGVTTCAAGQPTAASDPRTFQFALKLNF